MAPTGVSTWRQHASPYHSMELSLVTGRRRAKPCGLRNSIRFRTSQRRLFGSPSWEIKPRCIHQVHLSALLLSIRSCYIHSSPHAKNWDWFAGAAYVLALCTWLAAPAYARVNAQPGPPILAEYAGPWPVFVACGLTLNGLVLALIPVRRGEKWAIWLSTVSAHSPGDSHRHRPTLFGGARSAPAWRSYLHDLHGSWFGQPHVGRTATFQARSLWCCRSK